ncbi:MAG: c-type cytochrome [Candidatus Accumulibacter phosphatis]|jgi:cytochrome c553|uniref:Cytochrome c4 n=2 Tax=Candidatus Accumulibacter TaxID=327159 RepID=A0A080LVY6_9PROT|nr:MULTISPECIES: c-type cytochrome [Candidatus Accumulibacter]KFB72808.1 MAG: Cytochrome c4 precursor [Candidatus Accumulibacter phosphatis]MBL8408071.1 c-type cytochrome [Accumulibacter sp.]NMQ06073.1 c-type cytochrome [Candidatus Accumulibacter contiguus]HRF13303.1 c-type cytochrome [Candidatus Accumulibacter phosphatis]
MNKRVLGFSLAMLAAALAHAEPPGPRAAGIEVRNYPWQAPAGEKSEALELKGNRKSGEEIYELCRSCHLPSAGGLSDGSIPQLAGQHSSVLIKQMADIRAGVRDNPTMYPFAALLTDPQELADVAAYIEGLCIPVEHGRYEGQDVAQQVATGKVLYEKECRACHGASGEGFRDKAYPVIAGQHYKYLLRQMTEIRDGKRRNANPEMLRIISKYDNDQLLAISAYQASLLMPGRMCKASAPSRKK